MITASYRRLHAVSLYNICFLHARQILPTNGRYCRPSAYTLALSPILTWPSSSPTRFSLVTLHLPWTLPTIPASSSVQCKYEELAKGIIPLHCCHLCWKFAVGLFNTKRSLKKMIFFATDQFSKRNDFNILNLDTVTSCVLESLHWLKANECIQPIHTIVKTFLFR